MALLIALWLVVLLLVVLVVGLSRRVTALSELVASGSHAPRDERIPGGPALGSSVPFLYEAVKTAAGPGRGLIVLFLEAGCAPCRTLGASLAARDMAVPLHPSFELAVITDDEGEACYADVKPSRITVQQDHELSRRLGVRATPFCVVVDPAGIVRSAGIPNELADVVNLARQATPVAEPSVADGGSITSPSEAVLAQAK
jgi:thioredoxin-related protein